MSTNPYQAPQVAETVEIDVVPEKCWRDEKRLVITDETVLPRRCPKCNRHGRHAITRKLRVVRPASIFRIAAFVAVGALTISLFLYLAPFNSGSSLLAGSLLLILAFGGYWAWYQTSERRRSDLFPNTLKVEFYICDRHRNVEWIRVALGFAPVFLVLGRLAFSKSDWNVPFSALYFPWIIIMILTARGTFQPVAKRRHGGRFWVEGCAAEFLNELEPIQEATAT